MSTVEGCENATPGSMACFGLVFSKTGSVDVCRKGRALIYRQIIFDEIDVFSDRAFGLSVAI